MEIKKELYEGLQVYCATDKSYCWANTISAHQVTLLDKFASENGYGAYFGRTGSGRFYGCVEGTVVELNAQSMKNVFLGDYKDGAEVKSGLFLHIFRPVEDEVIEEVVEEKQAVVEQPTEKEEVKVTAAEPEKVEVPVQLDEDGTVHFAEVEPTDPVVTEEHNTALLEYKALYDDLVDLYNKQCEELNAIKQAFAVIKELLK